MRARRQDGALDLPAALSALHDRLHVRTLLCEGGPYQNTELLSAGLVDELFLSVSPLLAGEDPADSRPPLRILAGSDFDPPLALELLSVLEHDSHLFLRYRLRDALAQTCPRRRSDHWRLSAPCARRPDWATRSSLRYRVRDTGWALTATFSTTLLGTITVSSPVTNVVLRQTHCRLTVPSI